MVDKNKAIITYLNDCPTIANNPLFFNFGVAEDNAKQLITTSTNKSVEPQFIDGSVLKQYTFTIIDFRSAIHQALVADQTNYPNENVEDLMDVQSIIDWIKAQDKLKHYPTFDTKEKVEKIEALTDTPTLKGIDKNQIISYNITIRVTYLDTSDCVWG